MPWLSKALQPSARPAELLAAMSLDEKFALFGGVDTSTPEYAADGAGYAGYVPGTQASAFHR